MFDWLFKKKEDRSVLDIDDLSAILQSGNETYSITKAEALNIPAVAAAVNFVAGTVATLPVKLYQRKDGQIHEAENDYRNVLLNRETGDILDAVQFKKAFVTDYLLNGVGYAYIDKIGNKINGIYYVENGVVSPCRNEDPVKKAVEFLINGKRYKEHEIMRATRMSLDGATGIGLLNQNPVLFSAMYNALRYENSSINSGTKKGFLKSKYKLGQEQLDNLKKAWRKLTANNSSNDVMVLNEGLDFEAASSTAAETQLSENKQTNSNLVNAMLGLSSNLFDTPTYETYLTSIKSGILPVLADLESSFNKFLLLEKEKSDHFFLFDASSILKSSMLERYQGYELALKNGWLQVDEVRKMENMPPLGLDFIKLGLGDVLYDTKTEQVYTLNTNAAYKLGEQPQPGGNLQGKEGIADAN